jgi:uncharacterized membrane protein HdeD (DUF308 family)
MLLAQEAAEASSNEDVWKVIAFAGVIIAGVVLSRTFTRKKFTVTFARLYGFLSIATLAVVLAVSEAATEAKSAAFTLLGTVAGYLAGAKPTEVTTSSTEGAEGGAPPATARETVL